MFISKAEKHNLYKLIADLQLRVNSLETVALAQPKSSVDIEHIKNERKKASMREYYHRRKAERLEKEAKEKTAFQLATLALKTETSQ
jgi:hypothetical protein